MQSPSAKSSATSAQQPAHSGQDAARFIASSSGQAHPRPMHSVASACSASPFGMEKEGFFMDVPYADT